MQSNYEIPSTIKELFEDDAHYKIIDYSTEMDNIEAMECFIERVEIPLDNILLNDGTQAFFCHPNYNYHIVVDSGGLGDTFSHEFDVTRLHFKDYVVQLEKEILNNNIKEIIKKEESEITFENMVTLFNFLYLNK